MPRAARAASPVGSRWHGCDVLGVDINEQFLALACARHPEARFEHCDMRALGHTGEFDADVNRFTSFGYFDAATNDAVLAGFARVLRPGGSLLVDLQNPERIARLAAPAHGTFASVLELDGDLMIDRVRYDPHGGVYAQHALDRSRGQRPQDRVLARADPRPGARPAPAGGGVWRHSTGRP